MSVAGSAKTNTFVLASGTLMLGAQANVAQLNPAAHSLGLVKNIQVSVTPTYTDLTQGVRGARVASELTNSVTKVMAEVYEFNSSNMGYALGLLGTTFPTVGSNLNFTTAAFTGVASPGLTTIVAEMPTGALATFTAGLWCSIQDPVQQDQVFYFKLSANATGITSVSPLNVGGQTVTLTFAGYPLLLGQTFAAGSLVSLVSAMDVGQRQDQPYLAAKIVAPLPNGEVISILLPKVRVTKGFSLAFGAEKFDDMPFELDPYDLLPGDPMFSEFPYGGCAKLYTTT